MNSFLLFIMVTIDINLSDFVTNWLKYAFNPYTSIFGDLTFGILFGFIGAGVYVGAGSKITIFGFMILAGIIFAVVLPSVVILMFAVLVTFIGTAVLYNVYTRTKQ